MISNPFALLVLLLAVQCGIRFLSEHLHFKKYFSFLPSIFWIYFLPMLLATFGAVDSESSLYTAVTKNVLPASLVLLLIPVDVKAIIHLGKPALIMFFAGNLGVMLGVAVVFFFFKPFIGTEFWSGFGALSASWMGGSANFIAVKEAFKTPDHVFLPLVVVDTIVPYVWMGMLVALAGFQKIYDRWNRSDRKILDDLNKKMSGGVRQANEPLTFLNVLVIVFAALGVSMLVQYVSKFLPEVKDMISQYAWTIILASALGIALSFTRLRELEHKGITRIGYFLLYLVLSCIGAKASMSKLNSVLPLIGAGFLIILIHGAVTILVSRWIKAPLFLAAVASQANVGGVASAPIVAEIYQPGLASVGLLLAILGNIVGTYLGILTGQLCLLLTRF